MNIKPLLISFNFHRESIANFQEISMIILFHVRKTGSRSLRFSSCVSVFIPYPPHSLCLHNIPSVHGNPDRQTVGHDDL